MAKPMLRSVLLQLSSHQLIAAFQFSVLGLQGVARFVWRPSHGSEAAGTTQLHQLILQWHQFTGPVPLDCLLQPYQ